MEGLKCSAVRQLVMNRQSMMKSKLRGQSWYSPGNVECENIENFVEAANKILQYHDIRKYELEPTKWVNHCVEHENIEKADTNSPESTEKEPPPTPHLGPFTRLLVYNDAAYHRGNLVINEVDNSVTKGTDHQ